MADYSSIHIIYNPNSTGPGKQLATDLHEQLQEALPKMNVSLIATKHAGHAEKLTFELAEKHKNPLVVSVSGDGGYHEVVNGAAKAYGQGYLPITALLPAGNANDHHHSLNEKDLLDAILAKDVRLIDLLHLNAKGQGRAVSRYAHSYIGFGLTPTLGKQLTAIKLNFINEAFIVVKGLLKPPYFRVKIKGQTRSLDNLMISNINRMAKVLTLSKDGQVDDGLFEVNIVGHRSRWHLYAFLRKAAISSAEPQVQTDKFTLETIKPLLVQCDGEVIKLPASARVTITISEQPLRCIV